MASHPTQTMSLSMTTYVPEAYSDAMKDRRRRKPKQIMGKESNDANSNLRDRRYRPTISFKGGTSALTSARRDPASSGVVHRIVLEE